jgi:dienelactone hydrolase
LRATAVRWEALAGVYGEGVLYEPVGTPRGAAVYLPDAGTPPEQCRAAQRLAAAGYRVLALVLVDLETSFASNPAIGKTTRQSHREWIYRMAFPVGRHIIGYEVQKALAAAARLGGANVLIGGDGEGAMLALYAAVLDERLTLLGAPAWSMERPPLYEQPLYRNVFGVLRDVGDEGLRRLLGGRTTTLPLTEAPELTIPATDNRARMRRQVDELVRFTQRRVELSEVERERLWSGVKGTTAEEWRRNADPLARRFREEVIGLLPGAPSPPNVRTTPVASSGLWEAREVRFEVRPDVAGYGVLLLPRGLKPGERRPLLVVQHGLQGRPQHLFAQTGGRTLEVYRNFGAQLAELGFVVYLPQNPYIGDFRPLVRRANPLGLTLYSFIEAQYRQMLDWLVTLPEVDPARIGYYGLSYGGKTALRSPPFDERYRAVVCAGDFNEWIRKLTSVDAPYSYMYTDEYELLEWNLAAIANHAELARLVAPRPFLVERGHRDNVGVDEWVSYEYARLRRFYDELGIGDRTGIVFFNGPHRVDGPAVIEFLRRHLGH